jgi:hypothetical protein
LLNDLNEAGQQGWELVSVSHGHARSGDEAWTAFLKRPYIPHAGGDAGKSEVSHSVPEQNVIQPPKQ